MSRRDWRTHEFRAEAARHQFQAEMGCMFLRDVSFPDGVLYSCVTNQGALDYRASLEQAIRMRAEARALGQKVIKLAAEGKSEIEIVEITGKTLPQVVMTRRMEEARAQLARDSA